MSGALELDATTAATATAAEVEAAVLGLETDAIGVAGLISRGGHGADEHRGAGKHGDASDGVIAATDGQCHS
jgi:hypothetical protein